MTADVVALLDAGGEERELAAGFEEEGVPLRVEREPGEAAELAQLAAARSPLGVGIGADSGIAGARPRRTSGPLLPGRYALRGESVRSRRRTADSAAAAVGSRLEASPQRRSRRPPVVRPPERTGERVTP